MQLGWSVFPNYSEYKRRGGNDFIMPRTVLEQTFQFYGEYGIKDRLTLIYDLPVKQTHIGNFVEEYEGGAINKAGTKVGLGNVGLGVRGLVYDDIFNLSIDAHVRAPTAMYDDSLGVRTGYDAWQFYPIMTFGKGLKNFYVQMYFGGLFMTNSYTHSIMTGINLGYAIKGRVWIIGFLDGKISMRNGNRVDPDNNLLTGLYLNDQEYIAYGGKIIAEIIKDKFGMNLAVGAGDGNAVPKQFSLNLGLYLKWKGGSKGESSNPVDGTQAN